MKKYYDYDDIEYKGISEVKNLFDLSINEGYYKPIIVNSAFDSNYVDYESKEHIEIRPYLSYIINDHKTQGKWKVHSGNIIIDYNTQGEWKIQLLMVVHFISSKDSDEIDIMHTTSDTIDIMLDSEIF